MLCCEVTCFRKVKGKVKKSQDKWPGLNYPIEEINLENGKCQLRGRVGKILRRKTNLKDVKIYKPQQLSSGDDQDGLSAAQNEEVETPLSAAVLTEASQHGEATRPPLNRKHEQTRDTVPFLSSTGK